MDKILVKSVSGLKQKMIKEEFEGEIMSLDMLKKREKKTCSKNLQVDVISKPH